MFVPRQIQKKTATSKRPTSTPTSNASPKLPPPPPAILPRKTETKLCANNIIDPEVAREIVMALEILLSDYSMEYVHGDWLRERMRELEGKDDFIHLSTFVDCQFLAMMKPVPSQVSFMKALLTCESDLLELSTDKYHVRRKTKPSSFGETNPDDCTIYIEPHITNITMNPGKVARILRESHLPRKYLPVQFVESRNKSWGFVTLSLAIPQIDAESGELWPKDWIVMTKFEWRRRDTEYKELRRAALRVPAFHHPAIRQEDVWKEKSVRFMSEGADSGGRVATAWDETSSRGRELSASGFKSGLIVRLTNLNPSATKATIDSFVCRAVDRYLRKKMKKGKRNEGSDAAGQDVRSVKINYVDYEKGLSQAYIRQSNQKDSELIVDALQKRKRNMRDGADTKGKKAIKTDEQDWVKGKILVGEEERIYWEKLLLAKSIKGKGRGKKGWENKQVVTHNFSLGIKRPRKDSEASDSRVGKRIKFNE